MAKREPPRRRHSGRSWAVPIRRTVKQAGDRAYPPLVGGSPHCSGHVATQRRRSLWSPLRRYSRVTPAFSPRRFSSTQSADGCKRGVGIDEDRTPESAEEPSRLPLWAQAGTRMGWRARNGAMASAAPRGSLSCSACGSHPRARTARSAAATHAAASEPRSSRGQIEALLAPSTPKTGGVIRRASSRVKSHSCMDGSSTPK
jgi:hypothetical protein